MEMINWHWEEAPPERAKVLRELAAAMGAEIRPIYDLRPSYPMTRTACKINPYHRDLLIAHERCRWLGHVDASITLRDTGMDCLKKLTEMFQSKQSKID